MKETVLHYIWKFKKLKSMSFSSVDGQAIEVISTGTHNTNAGPDFLNATVKINGIEWNGHIEIHVKSSEWESHKHQFDAAYNNVILHVVYECNQPVFTHSGFELIQAEIKNLVNATDLSNALDFISGKNQIACLGQLKDIDPIIIRSQIERVLLSRLESRYENLKIELDKSKNDWENVTYKLIAKAFGTNINKFAFEQLANTISLSLIQKEGFSQLRTEAILFYYSGLLESELCDYSITLIEAAKQIELKYKLNPISKQEWKFSTMHADNFPTIRIAQFAGLIFSTKNIFSRIIEANSIDDIRSIFHTSASEFWNTHYTFKNVSTKNCIKKTSRDFIDKLIINAAIPILFAYGKYSQSPILIERSLDFLELLGPEKNKIVDTFQKAGVNIKSAVDSQGLIELKNTYCELKKCLTCGIGIKILGSPSPATYGLIHGIPIKITEQ